MQRKGISIAIVLLLATFALGSGGCLTEAAAFGLGWVARSLVPTPIDAQLTCYRNGVLIDCAEVPAELQPAN
jgi:hypothetical protein